MASRAEVDADVERPAAEAGSGVDTLSSCELDAAAARLGEEEDFERLEGEGGPGGRLPVDDEAGIGEEVDMIDADDEEDRAADDDDDDEAADADETPRDEAAGD